MGTLPELQRFTCCYRYDPFWVTPKAGTQVAEIPVETQYLLVELTGQRYALFLPILDGPFRASLEGNAERRAGAGGGIRRSGRVH